MTTADRARNNAISLEAKKDALSQRQSGDWKVSFTVQGIDMDTRLTQAPMGTRYAMVLVEIGEDELPVAGAATPAAGRSMARESERSRNQGGRHALTPDASHSIPKDASPDEPAPEKHRMEWRDVQPAAQAGIRCNEPVFKAFLAENYRADWVQADKEADECVRLICGVASRSELGTNHKARVLWKQLDDQFSAWKALEHA